MHICNSCGAEFEDPFFKYEPEIHYWLDDKPVEDRWYAICPECGSEDIDVIEYCEYCEEFHRKEEMVSDGICKKCIDEIIRMRQDMVIAYFEDDPDEKEFLAEFCLAHQDKLFGGETS